MRTLKSILPYIRVSTLRCAECTHQLGSLRSQMNSSLRSRISLTQCCLRRTTHADRHHLPIARVAHSFCAFGRHCFCRITHADRRHLPITRVARSFSAFRRSHSFHSHRITCTQKGIICPSLALLTHSALLGDTACAESHTQTGAICPSLALLAHSALSVEPTHFTRTEPHAHRKASSVRRSRCSLIQHSWISLLTLWQFPLVEDLGAT